MEKNNEIEIRFVNVFDINIDLNYQRLCHRSVKAIASDFDFNKFGVPKLSLRKDGKYYCIDGQHRIEAYKMLCNDGVIDNPEIACEVLLGLTAKEEAILFVMQGVNRIAVSPMEEMKAALFTGDKNNVYVIVHDVLAEYKIPVVEVSSHKLGARCIRALRDRCSKYGSAFIEYYASVIKHSGWYKEYDAFSLYFVIAITQFYLNKVNVADAIAWLKQGCPSMLLYNAQQYYKRTNVTSYDFALYIQHIHTA